MALKMLSSGFWNTFAVITGVVYAVDGIFTGHSIVEGNFPVSDKEDPSVLSRPLLVYFSSNPLTKILACFVRAS